jgi:hypothetical protein
LRPSTPPECAFNGPVPEGVEIRITKLGQPQR